ncbi:hypothetical protein [Candidatus Liberibacter brunswickensis]|uniref:hypothetical protein n=1 Tax=Candidatus Liberibacter brunswickensis TaxID=1968796 RepID=UPI002FE0ECED
MFFWGFTGYSVAEDYSSKKNILGNMFPLPIVKKNRESKVPMIISLNTSSLDFLSFGLGVRRSMSMYSSHFSNVKKIEKSAEYGADLLFIISPLIRFGISSSFYIPIYEEKYLSIEPILMHLDVGINSLKGVPYTILGFGSWFKIKNYPILTQTIIGVSTYEVSTYPMLKFGLSYQL